MADRLEGAIIADAETILALGGGDDLPTRCFSSNVAAGVFFIWVAPFACVVRRMLATGNTLLVSRTGMTSIPSNPDYGEYLTVSTSNVLTWLHYEMGSGDRIYFYLTANPGNVTWWVTLTPT